MPTETSVARDRLAGRRPYHAPGTSLAPRIHPVRAVELRRELGLPGGLSDPDGHLLDGTARDWFLTGPRPPADEEVLQLLAHVDGRVVGRMNLFPGELDLGDERIDLSWLSGFVVDPAHRGGGIGTALTRASMDLGVPLGAVGASAMSAPIFARLGFRRFDATRVAFIRRTGRLIPAHLPTGLRGTAVAGPIARVLAPLGDLAAATLPRVRGLLRGVPRDWRVVAVPRLDDSVLAARSRLRATIGEGRTPLIRAPRSAVWLDWMLAHSTDDSATRLRCFEVRGDRGRGRPVGGFVLKTGRFDRFGRFDYRDLALTSVKDWAATDDEERTSRRIARLAIAHALREPAGADAVHLESTDRRLSDQLVRRGGIRARSLAVDLRLPPESPAARHRALAEGVVDARGADGDHLVH